MNTFTIESWCKPVGAAQSIPMGLIRFRVNDDYRLQMSSMEDRLAANDETQADIQVNMESLG